MSLYNKYRPTKFSDLCGQDYIKKILSHQIKENKLSNAYLFIGPAGVGKTTVARIFAAMINATKGFTLEPDMQDPNVSMIIEGKSNIDVIEVDAASNRGIDEIKSIRERSYFAPVGMRKKIWIIDECHQLTSAAWEALLKILEEPPEHSIFVLCTTEPNKISETIMTRCMALRFNRITNQEIQSYLNKIVGEEKLDVEPDAISLLVKSAKGSMRQAISNLEKVTNLGTKVDAHMVTNCIGVMSTKLAKDFLVSVIEGKYIDGQAASCEAISSGVSAADFLEEVACYLHHITLSKFNMLPTFGLTEPEIKDVQEVVTRFEKAISAVVGEEMTKKVKLVCLLRMFNYLNNVSQMGLFNVQQQFLVDVAWVYLWRAFRMELVAK